eukprot:CAMPEP_0174829364 /NCGR_PEP_ID=MMETSP1114-20130205/1889_1 /TAXON_ID=312471 /ORGANISM="Neobodo designis, Strain CCAP 1951/1" /LENGTH=366 /DNA_ID=CAMNT_0016063109 /DNA_START=48 /DNA_END=1148 /DNA_ORIENTATION=+
MMRRTALRGCPAAFRIKALQPQAERTYAEKKDKFEFEQQRKQWERDGDKGHQGMHGDLISNSYDKGVSMDKSKMGRVVSQFDGQFTASEAELKQYMGAKQAAMLLGIEERKLFGLREEEVRDAWQREYTHAKNLRQRQEIDAAAEKLMEYCHSDTAKERTLDHFADHIIKAKRDIQHTIEKDQESNKNRMFDLLGIGQVLVSLFFVSSTVLMFRYIEKHDGELAIDKARRSFHSAVHAHSNDEPPPDYQTRYRDTPTSLDEHMAQPHPDITDPAHRALLDAREKENEAEEQRLVMLTDDVALQADVRRREAQRAELEERKAALKDSTSSRLAIIDGMVKTMPPPAVGRLRREEQAELALKNRKYDE